VWWTLRRPMRPLAYHAARAMFERAAAGLGRRFTPHDLRRTAAYRSKPAPPKAPARSTSESPGSEERAPQPAGGVQDVGDALVVPVAHRSTDSARMARSRVFSPPAETTSTARPSSASSSRDMRIRSNRELSSSKSTSRSMSLSGLSSPRAAEPKSLTLLAWWREAMAMTCSRLDSTSWRLEDASWAPPRRSWKAHHRERVFP
jgi:hypothetical protein